MGRILRARSVFLPAAGICLVLLSGCQNTNVRTSGAVTEVARASNPKEQANKGGEEEAPGVPEKFSEALNGFSYKTASKLFAESGENAVYSPISLYYALALSAEGANGGTRKEILELLGYPYAENLSADCKTAYEFLYRKAKTGEKKSEDDPHERYALTIANSLWADKTLKLKDSFVNHAADYFYADLFLADFKDEETPAAMSAWVKERTNGLITPRIEPAKDQILSIMNTVYFYDEWVSRFDKERTKADVFYRADGSEVTADFMNMEMPSHSFRSGQNFTSSALSLKNGSMEFYLPDEGVNVHELVKDPELLREMMEGTEGRAIGEVIWKVPKFSIGGKLLLNDMLKAMGMERAFDAADFSNMTDSQAFISTVNQETHVAIDENGVEAAAFTKIDYMGAAMPTGKAEMILNRPFFFVIKNRGEILFLGICEDPAR